MHVGVKARHDTELARGGRVAAFRIRLPQRTAREPRRAAHASIASRRYTTGIYDSASGHLNPYKYTLGLGAAAARAGVRIFENSGVAKLDVATGANADNVVRTQSGAVRARHLLIAGNALLGRLVPELARKLMAVGTYIAATGVLGAERAARADHQQRRGRRHQLGARLFPPLRGPPAAVRRTRELFGSRSIRLRRASCARGSCGCSRNWRTRSIEYAWGGFVDITPNRAPHFGRLAPNAYFLQGFSGHGMVLAGIAGKLVAEAMAGTAERFDVFTQHSALATFPAARCFRRPALVLAMLWFRLKDLL